MFTVCSLQTFCMDTNMRYRIELQTLCEKSTDRLMCAEVYDESAFLELEAYLRKCVKEEKGMDSVSRQLLQVFNRTIVALQSKSEYLPELKGKEYITQKFSTLFGYLIEGVDPDSRQSGVPRII